MEFIDWFCSIAWYWETLIVVGFLVLCVLGLGGDAIEIALD